MFYKDFNSFIHALFKWECNVNPNRIYVFVLDILFPFHMP